MIQFFFNETLDATEDALVSAENSTMYRLKCINGSFFFGKEWMVCGDSLSEPLIMVQNTKCREIGNTES